MSEKRDEFVDPELARDLEGMDRSIQHVPQPGVPVTIAELAAQTGVGIEIMQARIKVLQSARRAAIAVTSPEDWLLFADPQGRVVAYLQDCGCDRVRDIFGIEIFNVSMPEKITAPDSSFTYIVMGSGKCALTQQKVHNIEGGRSSTDDFIARQKPPLKGADLELKVRKAARANLDGSVTRELAGLQSVPLEEILDAYKDQPGKKRERFREGRGFGAQTERSKSGERAPDEVSAPMCPKCKVAMVFREGVGKRGPFSFWGCPKFKSNNCQETIQKDDWLKELESRKNAAPASESQEEPPAEGEQSPIDELKAVITLLGKADNRLTPDGLCKEFFTLKANGQKPARALDFGEVADLKGSKGANWIHGSVKKMREKYANLLPPFEEQEDLPLE